MKRLENHFKYSQRPENFPRATALRVAYARKPESSLHADSFALNVPRCWKLSQISIEINVALRTSCKTQVILHGMFVGHGLWLILAEW
jgi:hypothetical protein